MSLSAQKKGMKQRKSQPGRFSMSDLAGGGRMDSTKAAEEEETRGEAPKRGEATEDAKVKE